MTTYPAAPAGALRQPWRTAWFAVFALLGGAGLGVLISAVPSLIKLIVILGGMIVVVLSFVRLDLGLLTLVFIGYTRFSDIAIEYHGAPSVAKFFVVYIFAGILMHRLLFGTPANGWERPLLVFLPYGLVGLGTLLFAADPVRAQEFVEIYVKDVVIVLAVGILLKRGNIFRQISWTLIAAGIFLGSISVLQAMTGTFDNNYFGFAQAEIQHIVLDTNSARVAGNIGDPNFYAQILVALVPLTLDRLWNEKKYFLKLIALWGFAVTCLSIVFTYSRGGFLALVFVVLLMLVYRPPRPQTLLIFVALGLFLLQFVPLEFTERLSTLRDLLPGSEKSALEEPSFRGRASELMVGWMMFAEHPILGVGWNNYPVHYLDYSRRLGLDPRLEERQAHNLYLEIAAESGILGLAAFSLILLTLTHSLWRSWSLFRKWKLKEFADLTAAYSIGLAGYLFAGIFIHNAYPRFLWLLIGIAIALRSGAENEAKLASETQNERLESANELWMDAQGAGR